MGKTIDLIGQKFGYLTVIARAEKPKNSSSTSAFWLCKCDCGNEKIVSSNCLRQGKTKSCGCKTKEMLGKTEDLTGKRFGLLTVLKRAERPEGNVSPGAYWLCKCDCGNEKVIMGKSLRNGKTKSCGCKHQMITDISGQRFGKLVAIEPVLEQKYVGKGAHWKCLCDCGNTTIVRLSALYNSTQSCGCLNSKGEMEIKKILEENNISYSTQYSFGDLKGLQGGPLRFDFAIFENQSLKYLIEFQGEQHFQNSQSKFFDDSCLKHDQMKRDYCQLHNIPLIEIPYLKRGKIGIEDLLLKGEREAV